MSLLAHGASWLAQVIIYKLALSVLITVLPGIPPQFRFESFSVVPPRKLEEFPKIYSLDKAEIFYEGKIPGLESISICETDIFTADAQGNVIKINENGEATTIVRLQFACENLTHKNCSWPLGFRFDPNGKLVFADQFGGIIRIDVDTGEWETVVNKEILVDGLKPNAPNDLDIAKDGTIYWSDVSTHPGKFPNVIHEVYGQPSGRLMKYDPKTGENSVLLSNVHMANGVCLSENEDFVLLSEIVRHRILRYYLKGPNAGEHDVFIDGLPGAPDNIRSNGKGGFYVGLCIPWTDEITNLPPLFRLDNIPKTAMVLELNVHGEIIKVLRGNLGEVHTVSQLTLGGEYAYLVSPFQAKVWRMRVGDLKR